MIKRKQIREKSLAFVREGTGVKREEGRGSGKHCNKRMAEKSTRIRYNIEKRESRGEKSAVFVREGTGVKREEGRGGGEHCNKTIVRK